MIPESVMHARWAKTLWNGMEFVMQTETREDVIFNMGSKQGGV